MSASGLDILVWGLYAVFAFGLLFLLWKVIQKTNEAPTTQAPSAPVRTETESSGLKSDILKEGSGPKAKHGDLLTVHYTAFLTSGQKVDSSYDRGKTLTFKLGAGKVIDGWDAALKGAQAGETRKVTIPAKLAYGKKGSPSGKIPPNSTVIFEIELLKIE